jgi:hypothetical protein
VPTTPTTVPTTTTAAPPTTTTESKDVPGSPTTTEPTRPDEAVGETTTTLGIETTTTTTSEELALKPGRTPPSSGPRQAATGIQTGYQTGLFGSFGVNQPEVLGVELSADLRTAVEVIRASWIWMLALAAVVATLIVTGLDHRGPSKGTATTFGS